MAVAVVRAAQWRLQRVMAARETRPAVARSATATAAAALTAGDAVKKVTGWEGAQPYGTTSNPNQGENYQVDAAALKAGTAYLAGALGDMLEDVNRGADGGALDVRNGWEGAQIGPFWVSRPERLGGAAFYRSTVQCP